MYVCVLVEICRRYDDEFKSISISTNIIKYFIGENSCPKIETELLLNLLVSCETWIEYSISCVMVVVVMLHFFFQNYRLKMQIEHRITVHKAYIQFFVISEANKIAQLTIKTM